MGGQRWRDPFSSTNLNDIETFDIQTSINGIERGEDEARQIELECLRNHFPDDLFGSINGKGTGGMEGSLGYFCSGRFCMAMFPHLVSYLTNISKAAFVLKLL